MRTAAMIFGNRLSITSKKIWLTIAIFFVLFIAFTFYVYTEKEIDRANDQRHTSYLLADQLRQSSDDLTRMVRTYAETGDRRYQQYYQDILDIRNGKKARPEGYLYAYWDLVIANTETPRTESGQAVSLLALMQQAGFTNEELTMLATAKAISDELTSLEFTAMSLLELTGPNAAMNHAKARAMLHDKNYHQAKAKVMQPINAFYRLMDERTNAAIHTAKKIALISRLLFILAVLGAILIFWRAYSALRKTLGGSAEDIHVHMMRMGQGDLSTPITVKSGMENSVLANLSEMQERLFTNERERKQADKQLRIAAAAFDSPTGMVVTDVNDVILRVNEAFCQITGYTVDDAVGQKMNFLKSDMHDADFYAEIWNTVLRDGKWQGEIWNLIKNKVPRLHLLSIAAVKDVNGDITHYVGTYIDITEHKQAEDQLRIAATTFETHEAIMITDAAANIVRVNRSFERITGYSAEDVIGKNPRILSSGRHDKSFYASMWQEVLSVGTWSGEIWDKHKSGSVYPKQLTITAVKNAAGEITQYVAIFIEISERKNAEARIRKTEGHLTTILNSLDEVIWTACAPDFNLHHVSAATDKLYGMPQQAFMNDPELWLKFIHPDDKLRVQETNNRIFELGRTEIEYRIIRNDGEERWISDRMHVIYAADGTPIELVGVAYDVTERKLTLDALQQSERLAKQALEQLKYQKFALDKHAIVAITDVRGKITYANDKFCEISGYSQEELIGQDHGILNSGHHTKGFFKEMYRTVASGQPWHDEVCNRAKDGHLYWVDTTIAPFMDDEGKPQNYISIRTDITQRVIAEEESNHLAFYDTLTNLPNRRLLLDRISQALASSARSGQRGAILFLDLDHFKTLNDTLGHDIGDLLLQQVAERLTASVREGDTVARLGGDEFVVLLEDLSAETLDAATHTELIAEKILTTLNQPYLLAAHEYHSTPSIGATLFDDHQFGIEELLKQADIAMYDAKKAGRNILRFFDPKMQEAITTRVDLEHELRKALELEQFQLHYQIQVDHAGKPLGAEALIRWSHPERGMVSPFHFIPMAEDTGLILPIGQWVLDTACAQLNLWQKDPITSELILAVNVSAKQFLQTEFAAQVFATVQRHGIDPTRLKLELTESLLADNLKTIIATMTVLGEIGIKFSLDDFGTGYSSLQYLKTLPLNQLKIDQSFVRDLTTDSSDKAIVLTIITMAHSLGLNVIAEGVETEDQRQFLLDNGCMHYQGYLFSKPVTIDAFEVLLQCAQINLENK